MCMTRSVVDVRLMTFKRDLGSVGYQSALFSLTRGVCGLRDDVPHHWVLAVMTERLRTTPNVICE